MVKKHRRLQEENRTLRASLSKRDEKLRTLEQQIRDLNQRRQDAAKRLDELISRVTRLDEQLEAGQARAEGKR